MKNRHPSALRDRRIDRSRRIAQSVFVFAAASGGVGVGLMSHAAATPATSTTPLDTTTTTPVSHPTTTTPGHVTTTTPGQHTTTTGVHTTTTGVHTTTTGVHTTTTVWKPPVTVPVTRPTTCHTSASGQFLGCW